MDRALAELDLELTPGMRAAIEAQARLLLAWVPFVNLTAIRSPDGIGVEHVADSLAAVPPLLDRLAGRDRRRPLRLLDIGSGAGYPGLPVAVAIPVGRVALVESVSRRSAFLVAAARAATSRLRACDEEPPRMEAVTARAEDLAREAGYRDSWDVVTARAVAPLPDLVQLAVPLVRPGGLFVAWKRDGGDGALAAEIEDAQWLLPELGADPTPDVEPVLLSGLADHRLVFVRKRRSTPAAWRRRSRRARPLLP